MQSVVVSLLVSKLKQFGTKLGLVMAAQMVPILIVGVYGGVIADVLPREIVRFNKIIKAQCAAW
jgi:uncharacterized membrane protein YeiH